MSILITIFTFWMYVIIVLFAMLAFLVSIYGILIMIEGIKTQSKALSGKEED